MKTKNLKKEMTQLSQHRADARECVHKYIRRGKWSKHQIDGFQLCSFVSHMSLVFFNTRSLHSHLSNKRYVQCVQPSWLEANMFLELCTCNRLIVSIVISGLGTSIYCHLFRVTCLCDYYRFVQ